MQEGSNMKPEKEAMPVIIIQAFPREDASLEVTVEIDEELSPKVLLKVLRDIIEGVKDRIEAENKDCTRCDA